MVNGATPLVVNENYIDNLSYWMIVGSLCGRGWGGLNCPSSLHYSVKRGKKAFTDRLTRESCRRESGF